MSRIVKYVSSDFDWPIRKVWEGYRMPEELHSIKCTACNGSGMSVAGQELYDRWYGKAPFRPEDRGSTPFLPDGPEAKAWAEHQIARSPTYYGTGWAAKEREAYRICEIWNRQWCHHHNQADIDALVAAGRLMEFNHDWIDRKWVPNGKPVVAADVNRAYLFGMGHDAINAWVVIKAEGERLGIELTCPHCDDGQVFRDDEHKAAYEAWEEHDPPAGNCVQMWENVSEGSPISPVFESSADLAKWMEANDKDGNTADEWLAMIQRGASIGSGVVIDGVVFNGVEAVSIIEGK